MKTEKGDDFDTSHDMDEAHARNQKVENKYVEKTEDRENDFPIPPSDFRKANISPLNVNSYRTVPRAELNDLSSFYYDRMVGNYEKELEWDSRIIYKKKPIHGKFNFSRTKSISAHNFSPPPLP